MKLSKLFVIGIFFAVLIRLYVFSVSNNHLPVSSDESITVLQATQIAKGDLNLLFLGQPYGFPIESYLETLFINILPRTPFGVRIVDCLLGFVSLIIIFLIYRSIAPFENYWLGLLLFLFPSSYWLIIQYAYFLPFYTSSIDLWLFTLLLSLWAKKKSPLLLVAGFCYGLAFSVHILSVSIIVMAVPYCCLGENFKKTLKNIIIFFPALVVGLLPFLIAKWKFANAYNAVIQFREPLEALKALWDFVFINTLPRVFGITPPLFPDSKDIYDVFSKLSLIVSISYFLLLLSASGLKIFHFLKKLKRDKWPSLDINDVFIGASWVSIILFVLNTRSSFKDCRYLLPCLLSFPFVLSYLFANVNKVLKIVLGVGSIGLIMINIFSIFVLMHQWQRADFLDKHNLPDLKPVVDFLEDKKINRCYSTYRYSYRIMFLTDQKIVCSQRFNERFLGWPIPYKETVDSAKNVAYVLNPKARFLKPAEFEKDLTAMDVSCKRETINDFIVYYDFLGRMLSIANSSPDRLLK